MPQHNIFTRARRIFQNAAQPAQSQNQHPNPTDSANHSQYETDGSSYEMLVVESPSKSHHQSAQQQTSHPQHEDQPNDDEPPPTPRRRQSSRRKTELQTKTEPQTPRSGRPSRHRQSADAEKAQTEPRTPPRTPPPVPIEEPQTPSQRLPPALRRIDATPVTVGKSTGYNLRSRTRSQAPPTPQRTPARSQRQRTPARPPSRDLRQAPSARALSSDSARPSIVSRRQIDESSVITLRAMCRNFGLPTTGNKADLRVRALTEFESRQVVEEQHQRPEGDVKRPNDSILARASGDGRRASKRVNVGNEENSGQVPPVTVHQQEGTMEEEEDDTGKQLTTSTMKPAGGAKLVPVETTVAAKSDEPSVHAKSDAPEKDPVRPRHPAESSIANSPAQPIARRLEEKFAQPTVSSTGIEASSPKSPRRPPPRPTSRNADPSAPFNGLNRLQAPTESVDARGGGLDVAALFRELAAGRPKLTQAEYETVLRSLKDKAPDRPPPLQVSINAPHVSLNSLPNTPFPAFKPPPARSLQDDKGASLPQKTTIVSQGHVAGSSNKPQVVVVPNSKSPVADALEKSDDNKRSMQKDGSIKPPSETAQRIQDAEPEAMEVDNPVVLDAARGDSDERRNIPSVDSKDERADEMKRTLQPEKELPQSSSKDDNLGHENDDIIHPTTNPQSALNVTHQISLPTIFAGAEGGPHEGNIMNTRDRQHAPSGEEAVHENGRHHEDFSRELEPSKNTPRPSEVKRSGFATPRELVRRFNRFGEGHSVIDENPEMKPEDNRDPATSLLRRNARRSSSGVPLFHSTRGPSTAGRSILKTRTGSTARESQNRLRRMDRLHNLSGRSSFRVKRPVSASAGALLVDLRRVSGSQRPSSERPGQQGSYQAEIARRPPPMPASALKILKELEQIQESNRNQANRKRDVSPPPLPPSVVKRARRSGHFSKAVASSGQGLSIFEQDKTGTHSKYPGGSLSRAKPNELLSSVGRPMPKIPVVAYGVGRKGSKRSRTGADSGSIPSLHTRQEGNIAEQDLAVRKDDIREGSSPPRTRKRPSEKENLTFGDISGGSANQSVEATPQESALPVSSRSNAEYDGARSTLAEVKRRDFSFPILKGSFSDKTFAQPLSGEQPSNIAFATAAQKTNAEILKTIKPSETIGLHHNENEHAAEPMRSFSGRPTFNEPLSKKPPLLSPLSTAKQPAQEPKGLSKSRSASTAIETRGKETKPAQDEGTNTASWPSMGAALARPDSLTLPVKEGIQTLSKVMDKSNSTSEQTPTNINAFQPGTTHQFGNNSVQAPAFSTYASPEDSPSAASAFPVPSSKAPSSTDGKEGEVKGENAMRNNSSVLHQTASPFGSSVGTKGATGIFSAPSKQGDQGDSGGQSAFGVSPFGKPTQQSPLLEIEENQKQPPLLEKDDLGGGRSKTPKSQSIPVGETASLRAGDLKDLESVQDGPNTITATGPGNLPKTTQDVPILPSLNPTFVLPENKIAGLSSVGEGAPPNVAIPLADSKPLMAPLASADTVPSTTPPSTVTPKPDKPDVSNQTKDETPQTLSNSSPGLFSAGPFSEPTKEPNLQSKFSFSSAPRVAEGAQSGPFSDSKFDLAFSSANSSSMFAFGSSTEKGSAVKPATSFSGLPDSAALDKEKQNPLTQITNPTPFTFGSQPQPSSGSGEVTESSGPAFGLSSGSEAGTMFGQSNRSTTTALRSSFGSAPSIFNTGGTNSFAAGSTAPAFGAPTQGSTAPAFGAPTQGSTAPAFGAPTQGSTAPAFGAPTQGSTAPAFGAPTQGSSAPLFGNVAIPSTPFGLPSGPAGATNTNNAASSMFGSASTGTSAPAIGGASAGSFLFANSNASAFGANSTQQQPSPFNQGGNAPPMSSGGAFAAGGAGGFNMGSATRGPPMPRRRLRGRRTLR